MECSLNESPILIELGTVIRPRTPQKSVGGMRWKRSLTIVLQRGLRLQWGVGSRIGVIKCLPREIDDFMSRSS